MYLLQYHKFDVSSRAPVCSADVVSEFSEYWQTPGLSGMDTIYGPARVTASDLVKKWRISMQGGSKAEEPRCLFSLTFMATPNRWPSPVAYFSAKPACWRYPTWSIWVEVKTSEREKQIESPNTPFDLKFETWGSHSVKSILLCVGRSLHAHCDLILSSLATRAQRMHVCN